MDKFSLLILVFSAVEARRFSLQDFKSGCADGSTEAFQNQRHPHIAACEGSWEGHIENASYACASGWQVCSYREESLLRTLTWKDSASVDGCFAFNAAQDGGQCNPCTSHLEQDDLAAVGRGCAHQSYGQDSCISGGQVAASCCVDTHYNQACTYRPGVATGVLCCRTPGVPPQILVEPKPLTHVTTGTTFVLSCQVMGSPTPRVQWFKNGDVLPSNQTRITAFSSGYLLISETEPSDSARYTCSAVNEVGHDSAEARVIVTDGPSGCADGTTDGLSGYEEIQACRGTWRRHVKRARHLCARGWHVCSPKHTNLLKMLSWDDVTQLDGCYAYNGANLLNQCSRCFREYMAGVGKNCGRIRKSHKSCLAQGRIDVHRGKSSQGCNYVPNLTTGVLCCKKQPETQVRWQKTIQCRPKCANGGTCTADKTCSCPPGYKGVYCQNAVCPGGCIPNSDCVAPGTCRCRSGYTGHKCQRREHRCRQPCQNGGRCRLGRCVCPKTYEGHRCQNYVRWRAQAELNRTER